MAVEVQDSIPGSSGLRQVGVTQLAEGSPPGTPRASGGDLELLADPPHVGEKAEEEEQLVEGEENVGDKGKRWVVKLLPEENEVMHGEVLDQLGLCLHTKLLVLIYRQCKVGVGSAAALSHTKNQHGVVTSGEEKKGFNVFCKAHGRVCQLPKQVSILQAGGPPVRGIAAPVPGHSCQADPLHC
ncbi:hypothetical protein L210DRAFT_3652117 [Boletus edulis BED1]|uniref:Uncharacterized protein n=1 Tax=Boletus edulis BED1 TaxID=1328754 RepID=A0AAD4BGT3_BOLED|nr:hypothetical protein L210DRAFT_3652117 [Boletus edulis BED1]